MRGDAVLELLTTTVAFGLIVAGVAQVAGGGAALVVAGVALLLLSRMFHIEPGGE